MKPLLLSLVLACLASAATAQGSITIPTYSIGGGAAWVFRYQLDHGSTSQSIHFDVTVMSQSSSGVTVRVLDVDEKYAAGANAEAAGSRAGTGACNVSLTTSARTGVHPVLVIVQTFTSGDTVFSGSIDIDAGGIAPGGITQSFRVQDGLFMPFGLYAAFNADFTTTANFTTNFTVDFGSTPQGVTVRFEGIGTAVSEVRLYDVTGGNTLIKTLNAPMSGNMSTWDWVTTQSYSGEVEFRVEVQGTGNAGDIFWAVWLPDTVTATGGYGDGVPVAPKSQKNSGGGCAATGSSSAAVLLLLLATGVCAIAKSERRRRRNARNDRS